jgi:hypothetical protein
MGNVVELRPGHPRKEPTLLELVARVREIAKNSSNVGFDHPHVKQRMVQRGKTMREVIETLEKGEGVKGPDKDAYGDYRIKLRRCVCGKRTQIVVAVRESDLTVITII